MVTALTQDRRALLVTEPFLSASVVDRRRGQRLLPATVDGDDRLWSVDVGGAQPRVEVRIDDVWRPAGIERLDGRLTAFRVSVDGTRVAVVVERGAQERGELLLGRVVQGADGLRVEGFRRVELLLVDVRSASWADASSVVVVGGAAGAILEPTSVNLNRTVTTLSGAPLVGVTGSALAGRHSAGRRLGELRLRLAFPRRRPRSRLSRLTGTTVHRSAAARAARRRRPHPRLHPHARVTRWRRRRRCVTLTSWPR
jgi:Lipoprotein LpqB beta-propeller domain